MDIQLFQNALLKSLSFLYFLAFVLCPETIVFSYCTLLLFFYVVQHCENKRRTDKDQTLWKINKTFNIIRPQFNSPCSSSATTSFFQSPPVLLCGIAFSSLTVSLAFMPLCFPTSSSLCLRYTFPSESSAPLLRPSKCC